MRIKETKGRITFNIFNVVFLLFMIVITLYPMLHVLFASFSNSNQLLKHEGLLLKPAGFSTEAYKAVFANPNIVRGYKNTLIVLFFGLAISMLLTIIAAYVLSRKNLMFGKAISLFIIFTMFFSGGMIPTYLVVHGLKLTNTYLALILPAAISTYNLIILRTGFSQIPESLVESAKIDGASHFTIMFRIVVPLAKATLAVIVLYYAVALWNSWFPAMIYLQKRRDLQPLQLVLRGILIENDTNNMQSGVMSVETESVSETIKYAVIVVATLPVLVVYPFLQKYFVKGVMIGAVKG